MNKQEWKKQQSEKRKALREKWKSITGHYPEKHDRLRYFVDRIRGIQPSFYELFLHRDEKYISQYLEIVRKEKLAAKQRLEALEKIEQGIIQFNKERLKMKYEQVIAYLRKKFFNK